MRIVQPSFHLTDPYGMSEGIYKLRIIEKFARISHRAEDDQTEDSWKRFVKAVVLDKGDWSVAEHCTASVTIRTDRAIANEITRHRHFSFTQESTRFVNYGKKDKVGNPLRELEFIEPTWNLEKTYIHPYYQWERQMYQAEQAYLELLGNGQSPQAARGVLPLNTATTLAMTGNLRAWRWFFMMRDTKESHPDLKLVSVPLLRLFRERIPILYDDLEPDQKQSVSLSRPN